MCVPLWNHERVPVGILQIDTQDVQARFCPEDLDLLVAVAGPVSAAVDNARLLEEARREKRRLELLADAGAVLSVSFDDGAALGRLARLVVPQLADLCLIDLGTAEGSVRPRRDRRRRLRRPALCRGPVPPLPAGLRQPSSDCAGAPYGDCGDRQRGRPHVSGTRCPRAASTRLSSRPCSSPSSPGRGPSAFSR